MLEMLWLQQQLFRIGISQNIKMDCQNLKEFKEDLIKFLHTKYRFL